MPCRKCGTPNPIGNEYCRKCGAVLAVPTAAVKAQRRPVLPAMKGIRWRWVGMSVLVILGAMAILLGAVMLVAYFAFDALMDTKFHDLGGMTSEFLGLAIAVVTSFLVAFALGGLAVAWLAGRRIVMEPVIAAFVVLTLLGVVGSAVTGDALLIAAVMLLPSAALAGLGGRLGDLVAGVERKR